MSSPASRTQRPGLAAYWTLRVLETVLLLSAFAAMAMFAWSFVDIVRIERTSTAAVSAAASVNPPLLWPGIFLFVGSMVLLQVVRAVLGGSRRADGSPKADARGAAAATTAEVLASLEDDTGTVPQAAETTREG
jgi:hypothetical protein